MRLGGIALFVSLLAVAAPAVASAQVIINEVVVDPQTDWNDSTGGDGNPFEGAPGTGSITSSDEYVELYNAGPSDVDLTGWTIEMVDSTPETHTIGGGGGVEVFTAGSLAAFPSGEYLVIGNPVGANNNEIQIILRDSGGFIVDFVTIGDGNSPGYGRDGNATGLADESVSRATDGVDTDSAVNDWAPRMATPGAPNPSPAPVSPGAVLVNEVVTDPQTDWSDSAGGNGVPCDGTPGTDPGSSDDEYIELLNATMSTTFDLTAWIIEMQDTSTATDYLVLEGLVTGSECSPDAFSPGCHLVICDPTGTMNNSVLVRLRDSLNNVVDTVEVGDDVEGDGDGDGAPNGEASGNATSPNDESISRIPDGADTGDDAADFGRYLGTPGASNPVDDGAPALVINEVVTDPQSDWNDTAGGNGTAFDDMPGTDAPTSSDEYIEIHNPTGTPVNLVGWTVEMIDTTPDEHIIGTDSGTELYSAGSDVTNLMDGGYLVIGNPPGVVNNEVTIVLRDLFGNEVDRVVIDGPGAPAVGRDGDADDPVNESVSRIPNGSDTGDDAADFLPSPGTPLAANLSPAPATPGDVLINEVVTDPLDDWGDSGGGGTPFDGTPGSGAANADDQWIELYNATGATIDLSAWSLEMLDTSSDTELIDLDDAIAFATGGCTAAAFTAGCYLVIGDPRGEMDSEVFVRLRDATGQAIDTVELGDDPAGDGDGDGAPAGTSTMTDDEAVARLPDATDTDDDTVDFNQTFGTPGAANMMPVPPTPDAGVPDAGSADAGSPDAGAPDAGTPDAGAPDASTADARPMVDAGGGGDDGDGGCCRSSPAGSGATWALIAMVLLGLRRRGSSTG